MAVTKMDDTYYGNSSNWMKDVAYGIKDAIDIVSPYAPQIIELIAGLF